MRETFRTFKRSARSFEEFASAKKITDRTGLTREEARQRCEQWNNERTPQQVSRGTKLEFERE